MGGRTSTGAALRNLVDSSKTAPVDVRPPKRYSWCLDAFSVISCVHQYCVGAYDSPARRFFDVKAIRPRAGRTKTREGHLMGCDNLHTRETPAHGVVVPLSGPVIVYVTCCSKDRVPWMADAAVHAAMRDAWRAARAWLVGRYVIMPDHVHLFAARGDPPVDLERWMEYWKRLVSRKLNMGRGKRQSSHWDTRMRTQESYNEKLDYVLMNPVRKGLVERPEDWPYAGEIHPLDW